MVAIPQTDGLPHPVGQSAAAGQTPSTPRKAGDVGRFLKRLNLEHDLNLPWNERESPSKKRKSPGRDVASAIGFLYFKDPSALDGAIDDFRKRGDSLASEERKVNFLLERLTIAKTESIKAKRTTGSRRSPEKVSPTKHSPRNQNIAARAGSPASRRSKQLPEPASPTLSVKHAPYSSFEMPADDLAPPAAGIRMPSFKRPRPPQSTAEGMVSSRSARRPSMPRSSGKENNPTYPNLPPPMSPLTSYRPAGYNSVDTSFTSNGLENSFWSNVQQGTQDPASPATTVEDSFHTAEEERQLGLDGANDCSDIRSSPSENYGDFPSQLDGLLDNVRQAGPGVAAHAPVAKTPPSSFHASGLDDIATQQLQLPSPAASVPRLHQLTGKARVESIPSDGLSSIHLPAYFASLPFELRWDVIRVLQTKTMTAQELLHSWNTPKDLESLRDVAQSHGIPFEASGTPPLKDLTFVADLRWVKTPRGRVFDLQLLPARKTGSNSFTRKFGGQRFLSVNLPSLYSPLDELDLHNFRGLIPDQISEMLNREQTFLGVRWRRILVQSRDPKPSDPDFSKAGCTQILFFAERSDVLTDGLQLIKHEDVVDWWLQFSSNQNTKGCKLSSRLELGVSKTTPCGAPLKKDDIEYGAPDVMPSDDPDSTEFDDKFLLNPMLKSTEPMNDGCNRVSSRVMRSVQEAFALTYTPSVVQARFCGAKGLWIREDNANRHYELDESADPKKAITLGNSQVKVWQNMESFSDQEKLTLNVNNYDRTPERALLYTSFLHILVDRHVPKENLVELAKEGMRRTTEPFEAALLDREKMQHWIHANISSKSQSRTGQGNSISNAFPVITEDRVYRMTLSGFETARCKHLAEKVSLAGQKHFKSFRERVKIPIAKSTTLYGICDPTGVVEPGTIHVGFRNAFDDGEQELSTLKGMHAIVGRLPALGRSDMQKVRCVYKPELAHLRDVVVFSARGPCSLASKLQGGDYDGDRFVIYWEPRLVKPFRNAPVQEEPDKPETFGIKCDRRLVSEIVPIDEYGNFNDEDVRRLLNEHTKARLRLDWVGTVTNTYDELIYRDGDLSSPAATALRHLHDYLLDASKRGYSFDFAAWGRFRSKYKLFNLEKPAWKKYSSGKDTSKARPKDDNIIDYILFRVVEPYLQAALQKATDLVKTAPSRDNDLNRLFSDTRQQYGIESPGPGRIELDNLTGKVGALKDEWDCWMEEYRGSSNKNQTWNKVVKKTQQAFKDIVPDDPSSETARCWLQRNGQAPTPWDLLKASALGAMGFSPTLMFEAAGRELCEIKAQAASAISTRTDSLGSMKPKSLKRKAAGGVEVDNELRLEDDRMEIAEME